MGKFPFIKSFRGFDDPMDREQAVEEVLPMYVLNFLVTLPTHNPADVSERAGAILQLIVFADDARDAIERCEATLKENNPAIEIGAVMQALATDYQSSQLVPARGKGLSLVGVGDGGKSTTH